jgi:hypothetical protein
VTTSLKILFGKKCGENDMARPKKGFEEGVGGVVEGKGCNLGAWHAKGVSVQ